MHHNRQIALMTAIIMSVAMSIIGLFFLVFMNLNSALGNWNQQVKLIIYLDDNVSKTDQKALEELIARNTYVESSSFISREIAWENFKNSFSGKADIIQNLDFNPLPSSLILHFRFGPNRFNKIREFAMELKELRGVESLEYGEAWLSRFEGFLVFMQIFLISVGCLLGVGLILIVSNTIKLSIYSRREEVELMALLGARSQFIKAPFLMEGIFQAMAGGCLSLGVIYTFFSYMSSQFQLAFEFLLKGIEFQFFSTGGIVGIMLISAAIGCLGSWVSINHFLNSELRL